MPRSLSSPMRSPATWVALAAVLATCTGLAVAATSTSSIVHACVNKKTGALRVARKCHRHRESSISWNKEGPQGLRGPKGSTGAIGKAGATGPQGPQGATGPVSETLPSGRTERGSFVADAHAEAGDTFGTAISFSFELSSAPAVSYVDVGGAATADCPGSLASPQAAAGKLCLYLGQKENLITTGSFVFGIDAKATSGEDSTANKFGAQIYGQSAGPGAAAFAGSYAVTAP